MLQYHTHAACVDLVVGITGGAGMNENFAHPGRKLRMHAKPCAPHHEAYTLNSKAYILKQEEKEREIFIDNLLVRVHWIIEVIVVGRPFAMGV